MEFTACTLMGFSGSKACDGCVRATRKRPATLRAQIEIEVKMTDEEQKIHELFDGADRALMAADMERLSQVFAEDYVQHDATGRAFPKREVLENLGTAAIRYPVIKSTARRVRLFGDMAIVHGAE